MMAERKMPKALIISADVGDGVVHGDAQATAGGAEIWYSESEDGTNYTRYRYSHTVGETLSTTDDLYYDAGIFVLKAQYTKLAVNAVDYDIPDCTLMAYPKLPELQ